MVTQVGRGGGPEDEPGVGVDPHAVGSFVQGPTDGVPFGVCGGGLVGVDLADHGRCAGRTGDHRRFVAGDVGHDGQGEVCR